jgi:hypothetical protein
VKYIVRCDEIYGPFSSDNEAVEVATRSGWTVYRLVASKTEAVKLVQQWLAK